MSDVQPLHPLLDRIQRPALIVAAVALALCLLGIFISGPAQFFRSYLLAFMFWLAFPLGSLSLLMLQYLTGGAWGMILRRPLEAATRLLPLMALLFLPVLIGVASLYVWNDPAALHHGHRAANVAEAHAAPEVHGPIYTWWKQEYLTLGFFIVRAALYFAIWIGLMLILNRWSVREDQTGDPDIVRRAALFSGPGLILYCFTLTFATIDWVMSLDPHWYSTMFGVLFIVGQALGTLALMTALVTLLYRIAPLKDVVQTGHFTDLGNLLLAFTMLWAYVTFSQYLIIWSGNLPEETPYYYYRSAGGWQFVALLLVLFHFAVPFVLLLWRHAKRNVNTLAAIALGLLVMRWVDLIWLIVPTYAQAHAAPDTAHVSGTGSISWMDLLLPIGLGGIWVFVFIAQLRRRPLLPAHDYRLQEVLAHAAH